MIRQMERSRAATLALLRRLPTEEILRPRTQGDWSIKDVLAHIAAWEEEGRRRLILIARGRGDRIVFYDDMPAVDRFNAKAVTQSHSISLARVLRRLTRARQRLVDALRRLPPRSLNDRSHELPVVVWLRQFAWTHERAHRREIREWWTRRRATRGSPPGESRGGGEAATRVQIHPGGGVRGRTKGRRGSRAGGAGSAGRPISWDSPPDKQGAG